MGLLSSSVVLGTIIGFLITGLAFKGAETDEEFGHAIHKVLHYQSGFIFLSVLFFQLTFRVKPEVPPSAVALV